MRTVRMRFPSCSAKSMVNVRYFTQMPDYIYTLCRNTDNHPRECGMVDLKTIDERLAKIKEEADFLERARALLSDPRMEQLLGESIVSSPTPAPPAVTTPISLSTHGAAKRPYGQ